MAGWDTVLTALVSTGGTLGGVALTHRFTFRRWERERQDDRLLDQRDAAIELFDAGYVWAKALVAHTYSVLESRNVLNATSSAFGTEYDNDARIMGKATSRALMTISDESVRPAVIKLTNLYLEGYPSFNRHFSQLAADHYTEAKKIREDFLDEIRNGLSLLEAASKERFTPEATSKSRGKRRRL